MAAGLGFKDFTTGEVLTAADVDGYLMQGVWVFASATARNAAVTSPQEGNFAYLKDTNVTTYYTGSAWANLDTTGMTNPMTTTGDIIYSSPGSTPVRLGIGSTGNVLTVSGGVPVWSAPAGGGKVLQVVSAQTTSGANIATTSLTDTNITATITPTSASSKILVIVDGKARVQRTGGTFTAGYGGVLLRGSTTIQDFKTRSMAYVEISASSSGGNNRLMDTFSTNYLDSPATTSATTYKLQSAMESTGGSGIVEWQFEGAPGTITLLEIGA